MTRQLRSLLPRNPLLTARLRARNRDRRTVRAAAVELHSRGLTVRDVGEAFELSDDQVKRMLGESEGQ